MKSGCRERRLCRPGAMASPPSPRSRPIRVTPASLEHQGRLRHPSLTLTPQKARHRPASQAGTGTAALRQQAFLLVLAYGQQWALAARRFLRAGDSPHPLSSSLFLQKSAPVPGQSQTVFIKTLAQPLALRVYASVSTRFYKASVHASPLPGAAIFRATNSGDAVKEKGSPARKKQIPRA